MSAVSQMALLGGSMSFQPSDIANLAAWYRADQGITIATGVSQWNDISGNGRHLTQATGANQPTFGATSGPNSTPALTFDGSNDSLAVTFSSISQPIHCFLICRTTTLSVPNGGFVSGGAVGERVLVVGTANTNVFQFFGSTGPTLAHSNTTNHFLWESLVNNASSSIIRGNTSPATGTSGTTGLSGICLGLLVGNASYAGSIISEVVVYSSQISGTNLTNLRAYFASRYGVTTS